MHVFLNGGSDDVVGDQEVGKDDFEPGVPELARQISDALVVAILRRLSQQNLDPFGHSALPGTQNVYPSDIESVLVTHPVVAECTIISIPSDKWGETPLALIVTKAGNKTSPAEILEWLNARVAAHQRVSSIEMRESLPRNALGKVMKQQLRTPYWT